MREDKGMQMRVLLGGQQKGEEGEEAVWQVRMGVRKEGVVEGKVERQSVARVVVSWVVWGWVYVRCMRLAEVIEREWKYLWSYSSWPFQFLQNTRRCR